MKDIIIVFMKKAYFLLILVAGILGGCRKSATHEESAYLDVEPGWPKGEFSAYWRQGNAEISRFSLSQNRYRDLHPGEAVLIFVAEDFLADRQVKNERYEQRNSVPVLKLNAIHRFTTGIYDYSVMSSVFSPIQPGGLSLPLKVTNSSQDWCGQTFMQINRYRHRLKLSWNSYFELEGDGHAAMQALPLEDGLWAQVRTDPGALPTGRFEILPPLAFLRLMHLPVQAYDAEGSIEEYEGDIFNGAALKVYRLVYPGLQRTLEIVFEGVHPYQITGWRETYPALGDKELRSTIAKRTNQAMSPYWKLNNLSDLGWRDSLGVKGFPLD